MQSSACVSEVPEAGCLELRLLMPWTMCLGFQRAADCGVEISRQARLFSGLNPPCRTCNSQGEFGHVLWNWGLHSDLGGEGVCGPELCAGQRVRLEPLRIENGL